MIELDYSELENQLRTTEEEFAKACEDRDRLSEEIDQLKCKIEIAESSDVKTLLVKYILQRTPNNMRTVSVTDSSGRAKKDEVDFTTWQKGVEDHYKRKLTTLQHESSELRRILFKTRMDLFMKSHPEFEEIPFAYCGVNRQLLCTHTIYDLFAIEPLKELNLKDLLSHVGIEDAKYIFDSLKKGVRLKDYRLKDARSINLNTYPLFYSELPVGVAMILQSPELKVESGKLYKFVREILREVKGMSEEYGILKKGL